MNRAFSYLAVLALAASTTPAFGEAISSFQELSPTPANFVLGVDQEPFFFSNGNPAISAPATGSATGFLFVVPNLGGCFDSTDFNGFVPGDIALIMRGGLNCTFSEKGLNAQNAGAVAYNL